MHTHRIFSSPRFPLFGLAAVLGAAALVCLGGCNGGSDKSARRAGAVPVQIAKAKKDALALKERAIGTVQSLRTVAVKSQIDGIIEKIHFTEGQDVKAGDLLVTLDRRQCENALRIAKADLANAIAEANRAETDAQRYKRLDQEDAVSKEQYAELATRAETTKAQVQAKEAAVANAELSLSYTEIRAPFAGRTGQRALNEGALVKANDSAGFLVTINELSPITVTYALPEGTLDAIRSAQQEGPVVVRCTTRGASPRTVEGRLAFVDNAVDPTTGMITLKAVFDNEDHALWPGRFVDTETVLGIDRNAILVPSSAVQVGQLGAQIFVVKPDKRVELRLVKIGRSTDGLTVISDGIKDGETIVTDGQLRLLPDSLVEEKKLEDLSSPKAQS